MLQGAKWLTRDNAVEPRNSLLTPGLGCLSFYHCCRQLVAGGLQQVAEYLGTGRPWKMGFLSLGEGRTAENGKSTARPLGWNDGFKAGFAPSLAPWLRASYLTSLTLSFLIWRARITIPTVRCLSKDRMESSVAIACGHSMCSVKSASIFSAIHYRLQYKIH